MGRKIFYLICAIVIFVPLTVFATYQDVTVDDTAPTITLPSDSSSYTLSDATRVESFSVGNASISFVMQSGSIFGLTSLEKRSLTPSDGCQIIEQVCNDDLSSVIVQCTSSKTITVTPGVADSCSGGGGGGTFAFEGGGGATLVPDTVVEEIEEVVDVVCNLTTKKAYSHVGTSAVYYVTDDCFKRAFNNSNSYFTYFSSWSDVVLVDESDLNNISDDSLGFMPKGPFYDPKYGALVKIVSDPKVYLLLGTEKYWINSENVFESLNYSWGWIEDISKDLLDKYTVGSEISYTNHHPNYTIVKYEGDAKVYRLEPDPEDNTKQVKRYIVDMVAFESLGFRWDRIVTVNDTEVYDDGVDLEFEGTTTPEVLGVKVVSGNIFTEQLSLGVINEEVKQLQQKLEDLGYFKHPWITDYFGEVTETAVIEFQKAYGVDPIGVVGPATRTVLNSL